MSVDSELEDFAFALFGKLWTQDGFANYKEFAPNYPTALPDVPDDYCETVNCFRIMGCSFYDEFCYVNYDTFAHSRSDFCTTLKMFATSLLDEDMVVPDLGSICLAAVAAEMAAACLRKGNHLFIFCCPLAFAMVYEEHFLQLGGGWKDILLVGSRFAFTRKISHSMGRIPRVRRNLVYRLQVLKIDLDKKCSDALINRLTHVISYGALLDLPMKVGIYEYILTKYIAAVLFPAALENIAIIHGYQFLEPMYTEQNFHMRHYQDKESVICDIICGCVPSSEPIIQFFIDLYIKSVFESEALNPPEMSLDYPSVEMDSSSADPHQDERESEILPQEMHDSKPKDTMHSLSTKHVAPPSPSGQESSESNDTPFNLIPIQDSVSSSNSIGEVCDASPQAVDFEDSLPLPSESDKHDNKLKYMEVEGGSIQKRPPEYVSPPPYQSEKYYNHDFGLDRDIKYAKKWYEEYAKPPLYERGSQLVDKPENNPLRSLEYTKPPLYERESWLTEEIPLRSPEYAKPPLYERGSQITKLLEKNILKSPEYAKPPPYERSQLTDKYEENPLRFPEYAKPPLYERGSLLTDKYEENPLGSLEYAKPPLYERGNQITEQCEENPLGSPEYAKPPLYERGNQITEQCKDNPLLRSPEYAKPSSELAVFGPQICSTEVKRLRECTDYNDVHNIKDVKHIDKEVIEETFGNGGFKELFTSELVPIEIKATCSVTYSISSAAPTCSIISVEPITPSSYSENVLQLISESELTSDVEDLPLDLTIKALDLTTKRNVREKIEDIQQWEPPKKESNHIDLKTKANLQTEEENKQQLNSPEDELIPLDLTTKVNLQKMKDTQAWESPKDVSYPLVSITKLNLQTVEEDNQQWESPKNDSNPLLSTTNVNIQNMQIDYHQRESPKDDSISLLSTTNVNLQNMQVDTQPWESPEEESSPLDLTTKANLPSVKEDNRWESPEDDSNPLVSTSMANLQDIKDDIPWESPSKESNPSFVNPVSVHNEIECCKDQTDEISEKPLMFKNDVKSGSRKELDPDTTDKKPYLNSPQLPLQEPSTTEDMPSNMVKDEEKSEKSNKRKHRKKNRQGSCKDSLDQNSEENVPETPVIIELDMRQMILIMGVPFEKPSEKDENFMDKITVKNF